MPNDRVVEISSIDGMLLVAPPGESLNRLRLLIGSRNRLWVHDAIRVEAVIRGDRAVLGRLRVLWHDLSWHAPGGYLSDAFLVVAVGRAVADGRLCAIWVRRTSSGLAAASLPSALAAFENQVTAPITHSATAAEDAPVSAWSQTRKISVALQRALTWLGPEMRNAVRALLEPKALAIMAAALLALAVAQAFGVGEIADAALAGVAYSLAGLSGLSALYDLVMATIAATHASSSPEIDTAARRYAHDLTILGTAILTAIIVRASRPKGPVAGGAAGGAASDSAAARAGAAQSSSVRQGSSSAPAEASETAAETIAVGADGFTPTNPPIKFGHVTDGEINKNGKAVGFHYRPNGQEPPGARMVQEIDPPNAAGVYTGKVQMLDPATGQWIDKNAMTTFFPDKLSEQQIQDAILRAYQNGAASPGGSIVGDSGLGFPIQCWYRDGKIMSAYPLRQ